MPSTQPQPPKKEVALALLERSSVYVHLDPRRDAVVVPAWLRKQPQLVLQVGLNMPVPIPDLKLDDDGMSCTLSFNRSPFYCVVPWSSVFAMMGEDGRGAVWPDDVPSEVARQAQVRAVDGATQQKEPLAPRPAAALAPAPPDKEAKAAMPKPKRPRKRAALAAVKDDGATQVPKRTAKTERMVERVEKDDVATAPAVAPVQAARPAIGTAKKKRELPPYLRVVK